MDWITETIAIGNHRDAQDVKLLAAEGIRSIVCLDGCLAGTTEEALGVEAIEVFLLIDGPGNRDDLFRQAVLEIGELSRKVPRLLVHCHAGRSRSVVAVAAHLMHVNGWGPTQALRYVTAKRESVLTPGIERLLESSWIAQRAQ